MKEDTSEASRPNISALLWEDILGVPFVPYVSTEPIKTRGRPRKHVPGSGAKISHKMSDAEPEFRNLLLSTNKKLIDDFKEYIKEGNTPKVALENVCKLYRVPYAQAFNICVDEY